MSSTIVEERPPRLTTNQAAERLGISAYTLREWCKQKPPRITHLRVGGRYQFNPADIDAYLTERTIPATRMVRSRLSQRVKAGR